MAPVGDREWGAFDELSQIAQNFDLVLDVNASEARVTPLEETARYFGALLREQQPVGGMSGQVNKTLRDQFRMPAAAGGRGSPHILFFRLSLRHCLDAFVDGAENRPHRPRAVSDRPPSVRRGHHACRR